MEQSNTVVFTFLALGLMIGGLIAMMVALKYRTSDHPPVPSFNPRHWVPFWKWRQWYSPKGYALAVWGSLSVSAGALLAAVRRFM